MWLKFVPLFLSVATAIMPTSYSTLSDSLPTWSLEAIGVDPKMREVAVVVSEPTEIPKTPQILEEIGRCESGNKQFDQDGNVIHGYINSDDIGKYQINIPSWGEEAKKLGYDIFTEEGNTLMAIYIYEHYGTAPWKWSRSCWDPNYKTQ